jgi:hypothetical protein
LLQQIHISAEVALALRVRLQQLFTAVVNWVIVVLQAVKLSSKNKVRFHLLIIVELHVSESLVEWLDLF